MMLGLLLAALAPATAAPDVLLVTTPGVRVEVYEPLVASLRGEGAHVRPVAFPCSGDPVDARQAVQRAGEELPPGYVVVAHGLGATLALSAHPRLSPGKYVLLAPILDVWPVEVTAELAERAVGTSLDLSVPLRHGEATVQELLLGPDGADALGCVAPRIAAEVQGWIRGGAVPLALEDVDVPVWIGVGLTDAVATVEAVVPASRRLPRRELVRLGVGRLDPDDYGHLEMLTAAAPVRAATRAVLASETP